MKNSMKNINIIDVIYKVALIVSLSESPNFKEGLNIKEKKLKKTAIANTIEIMLNLNNLTLFFTLNSASLNELILFTPT